MHITSPDLSTYVLIGAGDAEATVAARRESTIAMWGVIVGAVVWVAAIASSIHP
jgi:hypothetical protein